jgi:hypothetical protein
LVLAGKNHQKHRIDHLEESQQNIFQKRKRQGGVGPCMLGNGQSFWLKNLKARLILDAVLVYKQQDLVQQ